jgi:signal transduction histidine kinase
MKTFRQIFCLGLAYFITGVLALELALPPGFISPFWPSAGIALAALLVCGGNVWPGIFIGQFLLSVTTQLYDNQSLKFAFILPALCTAGGASLQGIIGAKLIRRFVGYPKPLNDEGTIVKFLIMGGPIGCTVAATLCVSTLCAFGLQSWSSFAFSWGTWWVGDSIGVMIVAPLALTIANNPKEIFSRKNLTILIPSLLVFSAAVFIYAKVSHWEQEKIENELRVKTTVFANEVDKQLDAYVEVLRSVQGLYASSQHVRKEEFRTFVEGPLKRYSGLMAIAWDLRIKDSGKNPVLKEYNVELKDVSPDGKALKPTIMSEYMVPVYIEPEKPNAAALGFNLYSNEHRKKGIQNAILLGQPTATDKIRLVQDPTNRSGILLLAPVYKRGAPTATAQDREKNAIGVIAGVLKLDNFMNAALAGNDLDGISFEVEDISADSNDRVLFRTQNFLAKKVSSRDLNWNNKINFANREWQLNFNKSYSALFENRPWQAWFVLLAGLSFTGLFIAFLMVIVGRTSRIEDLVAKRSEELAEAKSSMILSSKMSALGEMAGGMAHEINTPLTIINLKVNQLQNELAAENINKAKINEGLQKIEDTVARIAKIIKGLRYFARDTKHDPFETVQVKSILEDTLYLCIERLRYNAIKLINEPCPSDLFIDCRSTEISQVLLNLLNNACDAISTLPEKWIEIKIVKKGSYIEIRITDSGKGIQNEVRDKIMQPFFTTKPVGKGTGLGLSISKGIIESHSGTLAVDTSVENTCFVVTLPLHQTNEKQHVLQ